MHNLIEVNLTHFVWLFLTKHYNFYILNNQYQ